MAPTNVKTIHQTSLLHIESNLDRLGLLSPTHGQFSQQESGQITLQSVLINKPKFLRATHHAEIRKNKIPRSLVGGVSCVFFLLPGSLSLRGMCSRTLGFEQNCVSQPTHSFTLSTSVFFQGRLYPRSRAAAIRSGCLNWGGCYYRL